MSYAAPLDRLVLRILRFNQQANTPSIRFLLTLAAFAASIALLTFSTSRNPGLNTPPALGGDAPIYDSLGWELAAGRGFALNFPDPPFLDPYAKVDPAAAGRIAESAPRGTIASRPPLLPLLLAGLNHTLGRQFYALRIINIVAMATVAAMLVWTVSRLAGPIPALIAVVNFLIVDPRVRITTREFLTEALACLLIATAAVVLARFADRPKFGLALLAGTTLGLAMLLRTQFVFWIPCLVAWIWLVTGRCSPNLNRGRRVGLVTAFILVGCAVFAPWGVRNCEVLGRFMPLGTQGTMELSAGYSDAAFERVGMWHNLEETGFFTPTDRTAKSTLDKELARSDHSRNQAFAWCRAHPFKAALLPFMKLFQEFRPHMSGDLYVLSFALLGLLFTRGTPEGRAWTAILAATAFGIAFTWSTAGRFVVPALFVLHAAAAIGVWYSLLACTLGRTTLQHLPADS